MSTELEFQPFNFYQSREDCFIYNPQSSYSSENEQSRFQILDQSLRESVSINSIFKQNQSSQQTNQTQINKLKSPLHNMQKHLFTLLQFLIPSKDSIIDYINSDEKYEAGVYKCVEEALHIIRTQKRKTKEQLVPIFGKFDEHQIIKSKSSYNCLAKYPIEIIRASFDIIKIFYISSLKHASTLSQYLSKSKMNKKEQFIQYIERFIEEVESNRFKFRLTKQSQSKMKNHIIGKSWELCISSN